MNVRKCSSFKKRNQRNSVSTLLILFTIMLLCIEKVTAATNIYSHAASGMFSSGVQTDPARVYVPNSLNNTLTIIDQKTYSILETIKIGKEPQHVIPSYDLKTLWVLIDGGNSVLPIDPKTSKLGNEIKVDRPYNLYFTMDGRFAIVIDDLHKRFDFRDPHTMQLIESVPVNCSGLNHMDFTEDGLHAVASCEISGNLVKLDVNARKILGYVSLTSENINNVKAMPQDVRLSPDGSTFYVADMSRDGVYLIDAKDFRQTGFIKTGIGAHGIYPSRDGKYFYVSNRGCHTMNGCAPKGPGSISVIDPALKIVVQNWPIEGGGSPDMGNINADGSELWLSGRHDHEVYVFETKTGKLIHRIPVLAGPHGLAVWPQPGRFSLGHTGNMR